MTMKLWYQSMSRQKAWGEYSAALARILASVKDPGTEIDVHGVVLGHSERRQYYNENDRALQQKVPHALEAGLNQPDWFSGVAAISARCPDSPRLLRRYNDLRGKQVLLGIDEKGTAPIVADCLYRQQLFWSAGMQVTALASSAGGDSRRSLLREVDRWVMQTIEQPELVC